MKILTVDDSRTIRRLVKKYLGGFPQLTIEEAEDGKEGLEKALSESYDLIILNVTMPVIDGTQMLEKLRENDKTKNTRVLMLTAESRKDLVLNMIQLGISDYIVKPFVQEVFVHKVSKVLGLDPSASSRMS